MSIDYGASIVVGYRFSLEAALKPFAVKVGKDESREEDRFDPKSGAKTGTEKVQTEFSYTKHVWKDLSTTPDEETPDPPPDDFEEIGEMDFLEKLAEANGFQFVYYGDSASDDLNAVFFPKNHPKDVTEGYDWGRFTAEGNLSWHAVAAMGKSLEALRQKLLKLGLKPKRPEVILAAYAS